LTRLKKCFMYKKEMYDSHIFNFTNLSILNTVFSNLATFDRNVSNICKYASQIYIYNLPTNQFSTCVCFEKFFAVMYCCFEGYIYILYMYIQMVPRYPDMGTAGNEKSLKFTFKMCLNSNLKGTFSREK
jgi:hypothetical protein